MNRLRLKRGVRLEALCPQMLLAVHAVKHHMDAQGVDTVITSGSDGRHSVGSLHYVGRALDFRTRHLREVDKRPIAQAVAGDLGEDFDVVLERTHLHIEYDPKAEGNS